jgi:hypothetical protein
MDMIHGKKRASFRLSKSVTTFQVAEPTVSPPSAHAFFPHSKNFSTVSGKSTSAETRIGYSRSFHILTTTVAKSLSPNVGIRLVLMSPSEISEVCLRFTSDPGVPEDGPGGAAKWAPLAVP